MWLESLSKIPILQMSKRVRPRTMRSIKTITIKKVKILNKNCKKIKPNSKTKEKAKQKV